MMEAKVHMVSQITMRKSIKAIRIMLARASISAVQGGAKGKGVTETRPPTRHVAEGNWTNAKDICRSSLVHIPN